MNKLEEQQREMRQRMAQQGINKQARAKRNASRIPPTPPDASSSDLGALQKRVLQLETENERLKTENQRLRRQKTIIVENATEKSYDEQIREQQHNYFKYSNARKW
jgi:hypothetical protein